MLGSVLYVAAHPDDENTRLITYFSKGMGYRTAYLSLTRGDGGQNLIGEELGQDLGVLRSGELLAARSVDGGLQYFSRAIDFGYSKSRDETLARWDADKILSDILIVMEDFRPDVIITRFDTLPGHTHGHHTTSAELALKAFRILRERNKNAPDRDGLKWSGPVSIYWNTSTWAYRRRGTPMPVDSLLSIDVGIFSPLLGESFTEIAARSRSMHKSQGFGSTPQRGSSLEYLSFMDGKESASDPFEVIDTTWGRVEGAEEVGKIAYTLGDVYDPENPASFFETLSSLRGSISALKAHPWKSIKLREVDQLILDAAGAYFEILADKHQYAVRDSVHFRLEAITRASNEFRLSSITFHPWESTFNFQEILEQNQIAKRSFSLEILDETPVAQPSWLSQLPVGDVYELPEVSLLGRAPDPPPLRASLRMIWRSHTLNVELVPTYKFNDPVEGETHRSLEIEPPILLRCDPGMLVFGDTEPKTVSIAITPRHIDAAGTIVFTASDGFEVNPPEIRINLARGGDETIYQANVRPTFGEQLGRVTAKFIHHGGAIYNLGGTRIAYDHITPRTVYSPLSVRLVYPDIQLAPNLKVGYIEGAGDRVAESLKALGVQVVNLGDEDLNADALVGLDAIVLGIRCFNVMEWTEGKWDALEKYMTKGGVVIAQYNTSFRLKTDRIAPYPLHLSRQRVTRENAPVKILRPDHPILNTPNRIGEKDFEGWVQERGLYFPDTWSEEYVPLLRMSDPGEEQTDGSLLVTRFGEGYYIYTGISWFRQLPAGVPGAYRIFANMISLSAGE